MRHEGFALGVHPPAAALPVQRVCYERSGAVEVVTPATHSRAAAKSAGNFLPRRAARRRIPAQAFPLKKYRRGTSPVSKMSDNEDATAALGHSEELSVQDPPGATIPEFRQLFEDRAKVPSAVRGQNSGNVFPDDPTGPKAASKPAKFEGQAATRVTQAASSSGDAKALTGGPSGQNVDCRSICFDASEVAAIEYERIVVRQQRAAKRIDLGKPCRPEAQRRPGHGHSLNARTNAGVNQPIPRLLCNGYNAKSGTDLVRQDRLDVGRIGFKGQHVRSAARDHQHRGLNLIAVYQPPVAFLDLDPGKIRQISVEQHRSMLDILWPRPIHTLRDRAGQRSPAR
jgi:hypothetical protein